MMKDQEIRNVFKREWEIPADVEAKMKEAYGWIGAKHEALQDAGGKKGCQVCTPAPEKTVPESGVAGGSSTADRDDSRSCGRF